MTQPIRKDPSGSKTVERLFAKDLQALIGRYGAECRAFVEQHHGRALSVGSYEAFIAACEPMFFKTYTVHHKGFWRYLENGDGEMVRDAYIRAWDEERVDPYRAVFRDLYFRIKKTPRALAPPQSSGPLIDARDLIRNIQGLAHVTITKQVDPIAEVAAILSYQHGQKWAEKGLSIAGVVNPKTGETKPFFLPPERRAIEKIKARNLMEIQGMTDELGKRMSRSLVDGFENSETMPSLIRRVKEVTDFGTGRATVIARTETMRAVNGAARDRFKAEGIERVEFLAAWDDRTCPECEGLHGQIFALNKAPTLPIHPQCRCTLAPVVGEE